MSKKIVWLWLGWLFFWIGIQICRKQKEKYIKLKSLGKAKKQLWEEKGKLWVGRTICVPQDQENIPIKNEKGTWIGISWERLAYDPAVYEQLLSIISQQENENWNHVSFLTQLLECL